MAETSESGRREGWGGSFRRFGDNLLGLVETRIAILSLEWAEERQNLTRLLLWVFAILACLQLGIVMGLVFLVLAIGEEHRVAALGLAALVLLLGAGGAALGLRAWLKRRRPMFETTIAELRKDREWIRGTVVSAAHETFAARRATLVAQASAEREALARKLAPLAALDRAVEKLHAWKSQFPLIVSGAGLALSALLLALPTGRFPLVRGGVALLNLAGSVKGLFSRR